MTEPFQIVIYLPLLLIFMKHFTLYNRCSIFKSFKNKYKLNYRKTGKLQCIKIFISHFVSVMPLLTICGTSRGMVDIPALYLGVPDSNLGSETGYPG
jgi:hypothetical protein